MKHAEIIAIGTELLLGQLIDTNTTWIAQKFSEYGIHCHFRQTVGDDIHDITQAIRYALTRADMIICTGGLGPTQDDLTREALALAIDRPLIFDQDLAKRIQEKFHQRQVTMSDNNLNQAYYPEGAKILPHHPGTAPGIIYQTSKQLICLLPGVPHEMKDIVQESLLPILRTLRPQSETIVTETLKVWGLTESAIAEILDPMSREFEQSNAVKLSYLASGINGISVRLSAKSESEEAARKKIDPFLKHIKRLLGHAIFGQNSDSMETAVARQLTETGQTLCLLETFSGGLIASRLCALTDPVYFRGGLIYRNKEISLPLLQQVQNKFQADIILNVSLSHADKAHNLITLDIHALIHDQHHTSVLKFPYHNLSYAMEFSVIHTLNFLRQLLIHHS